ncbi:MAG: iron-containing alcohol dehydrogenase [Caldilineaceae bacterium]
MQAFAYYQPTEILFGRGRLSEIGTVVARHGKRCLLVTMPVQDYLVPLLDRVQSLLAAAGVACTVFDGVIANPTTDCVTAGASVAKAFGADVVLGLGGGSAMDTAKAIAVEATHPGSCWDYLFFKTPPTAKTLPVIAVSTTSGTGSQVTQVAVVTETATKTKSALYNSLLYPRVAIVDPELMVSLPSHVTASTGFDAFTHAFESYLHVNGSPYTDALALEAMRQVVAWLPKVMADGTDMEARSHMAWADTLAGLCIANAGVTLPHGIGMTIGGQCPQVMHGEALAVTYPEFTRYTMPYAVEKFATVGRILDPTLAGSPDDVAAEGCCEAIDTLLQRIGMWLSLRGLGVSEEDVVAIADNSRVLPDYKNNPRVATRDEIHAMLVRSYDRAPAADLVLA